MALNSNKETINLIVCGVGGQGLITLARIIGKTAVRKNIEILISEVHGMAQRGGQVIVHIKIGKPESPLIPHGGADVILGLELIETFRNLKYANSNSIIIANQRIIRPSIPKIKLPAKEEILKAIEETGVKLLRINALEKAKQAGIPIAENIVMLGALIATGILKKYITISDIEETIKEIFPEKIAEKNIKALKLGYNCKLKFKLKTHRRFNGE